MKIIILITYLIMIPFVFVQASEEEDVLEIKIPKFEIYDFYPPKYIIIRGKVLFEENWINDYIPQEYYTSLSFKIFIDGNLLGESFFVPSNNINGEYTWKIQFPTKTLSVTFVKAIQEKKQKIKVYLYYKKAVLFQF